MARRYICLHGGCYFIVDKFVENIHQSERGSDLQLTNLKTNGSQQYLMFKNVQRKTVFNIKWMVILPLVGDSSISMSELSI